MNEEKLTEFKEDFALLIEAGFIAVKQLDEISALRIFLAAQALSLSNTAPRIGIGYISLNKLEIKQATKIFEGVILQEPDNFLARTFLGMCFLLTKGGRKKGEKMINEAMEKTTDPTKVPFFADQPEPPPEEEEKAQEEKAPEEKKE